MKKAYHPFDDVSITLEQYFADFGGKHNGDDAQGRPRARCPVCKRSLRVNYEDSFKISDRQWAHIGSKNNPYYCPLKADTGERYTFLDATAQTKTAAGNNLRASFFEHWKFHLREMRKNLNRFIDIKEFINIINTADKTHFWHTDGLREWQIPYIFFVWQDYQPIVDYAGKTLRPEWFRFWFSENIQNFDQILKANNFPKIVRGSYKKPSRGLPKATDLIDSTDVQISSNFLNEPLVKEEHPFVIKKMHTAFHNEVPAPE